MKVYIGPYKNWFGPYQLAELLCFWAKPVKDEYGIRSKPDWVHDFGEWLAYGSIKPDPTTGEIYSLSDDRKNTLLHRFLLWLDSFKERKIKVRIDRWDTWSMDDTLAHIVLPMLKQLKATKHGSPFVDDDDVPDRLRSSATRELTQEEKDTGHVDDNYHSRWDWVLDEMIFAFEAKLDDSWKDKFYGDYEGGLKFMKLDNGMSQLVGNETSKTDWDGMKAYQQRISNGFRLFGKYYEGLWD